MLYRIFLSFLRIIKIIMQLNYSRRNDERLQKILNYITESLTNFRSEHHVAQVLNRLGPCTSGIVWRNSSMHTSEIISLRRIFNYIFNFLFYKVVNKIFSFSCIVCIRTYQRDSISGGSKENLTLLYHFPPIFQTREQQMRNSTI